MTTRAFPQIRHNSRSTHLQADTGLTRFNLEVEKHHRLLLLPSLVFFSNFYLQDRVMRLLQAFSLHSISRDMASRDSAQATAALLDLDQFEMTNVAPVYVSLPARCISK